MHEHSITTCQLREVSTILEVQNKFTRKDYKLVWNNFQFLPKFLPITKHSQSTKNIRSPRLKSFQNLRYNLSRKILVQRLHLDQNRENFNVNLCCKEKQFYKLSRGLKRPVSVL